MNICTPVSLLAYFYVRSPGAAGSVHDTPRQVPGRSAGARHPPAPPAPPRRLKVPSPPRAGATPPSRPIARAEGRESVRPATQCMYHTEGMCAPCPPGPRGTTDRCTAGESGGGTAAVGFCRPFRGQPHVWIGSDRTLATRLSSIARASAASSAAVSAGRSELCDTCNALLSSNHPDGIVPRLQVAAWRRAVVRVQAEDTAVCLHFDGLVVIEIDLRVRLDVDRSQWPGVHRSILRHPPLDPIWKQDHVTQRLGAEAGADWLLDQQALP
eukprot:7177415-Prymnesium_polylepis.2